MAVSNCNSAELCSSTKPPQHTHNRQLRRAFYSNAAAGIITHVGVGGGTLYIHTHTAMRLLRSRRIPKLHGRSLSLSALYTSSVQIVQDGHMTRVSAQQHNPFVLIPALFHIAASRWERDSEMSFARFSQCPRDTRFAIRQS